MVVLVKTIRPGSMYVNSNKRSTMNRLLILPTILLISVSFISKAEVSDLEAESQLLKQACPERWESLGVMMNSEQVEEGDIWANEQDYLDWQSYLSSLAQGQNLTDDDIVRMSQDELTVVTECMAQRVKIMLMLGGTPLGESGLAFLNDSNTIQNEVENNEDITPGSLSTYPAESCSAIKEVTPNAQTGLYWVQLLSLDALDTYRVFCEMDHAGGGWMYWGYIGSTAEATEINIFEESVNGYDAELRRPTDTLTFNNVFSLNQFADTEMIVVLDSPDIQYAKYNNKYARYRYLVDSVAFNNGPLPCQGLNETFEYTKDDVNFYAAKLGSCEAGKWYPEKSNGQDLTILKTGNRGVRWGSALSGSNDTYNHDAWIYVR